MQANELDRMCDAMEAYEVEFIWIIKYLICNILLCKN